MKSIPARDWNALVDRLRRDQVLGCTILRSEEWRHPWHVSPEWNPDTRRWEAMIRPGFVNGIDPEVSVRADEAPAETLERLQIQPGSVRVDARLTEEPRMPLNRWRAIGRDAPPERTGVSAGEDVTAAYEPVPEFFLALGAEAPPENPLAPLPTGSGTRLLRATDLLLVQDRLATGTDWTFGTGTAGDGSFARFSVAYALPPGARERARLRSVARHQPAPPADPVQRLLGNWQDTGQDTLHVATVYLLSPEDEPPGAEPGPAWTPHVKHRVFWNLVHGVTVDATPGGSDNLTLPGGLGLGAGDSVIGGLLATINDNQAVLDEFLRNRGVEGRFWTT
jgi:hypothetical protein